MSAQGAASIASLSPVTQADSALARTARLLGRLACWPAAALALAEIVLLFSGVVARYGFHKPLIVADELSSVLFLWLAMAGAAAALHLGVHMRMTALVARCDERWQARWQWLADTACLAFLAMFLLPCRAYWLQQRDIELPGLGLSDGWRAAAMPVMTWLMMAIVLVRMAAGRAGLIRAGVAFGLSVLLAMLLHVGSGLLADLGNLNLPIFFVGVAGGAVLLGFPIAFAFGLATFSYLSLATAMPLDVVVGRVDEGVSHLILLSVPMFVFLGLVVEMTGMARAMVDFLASLLGHVRGGLSYVLVGAMYLVSGISGSKAADMAAVAPVLFPEMTRRGQRRGELVALLAATGAQTETIPPSIVLITIGSVTGVSIAALFAGGLLPGLVLALMLCLLVGWRARREGEALPQRASLTTVMRCLLLALPALLLPFLIRAAVIEGVATATEVSTVGIVYSLLVGLLLYRQLDVRRLGRLLVDTAALSGAILLIIGSATAMAWALVQSGFSQALTEAMTALPGGATTFMMVSVLAFVVLGSVLEGIPAIVLFGPLLFPIARDLGINEVHYAMVVVLSMGLGLFSPPFGVGYYSACAVSQTPPDEGIRPIVAYMLVLLAGVLLVAAVPWISLVMVR